ncbi:MAG: hypothetical protein AAFY71_00095 [Bacteroidota bacterium]
MAQRLIKQEIPLSENYSIFSVQDILISEFKELNGWQSTLNLIHDKESSRARHLHFVQTVDGIPLEGTRVIAHISDRKIQSLQYKLMSLSSTPLPTAQLKPEVVELGLLETLKVESWESQVVWWLEDENWIPALKVRMIQQGGMLEEERIMSLLDGGLLQKETLNAYFRDTTGTGRIFLPDPSTKAELPYGFDLVDKGDSALAIFENLMDTVELKDIRFNEVDSVFELLGPYVQVVDRAARFDTIATSQNGEFYFDRSESGFEDVMAYFHIDSFQRFVQSLGFEDLMNRPIQIDPHGLGNNDLSTFVSNNGNGYILMGEGGVDDAEDADVIVHEYIHALSYDASPNSRKGFERNALDEGYADYFTAAYSYDLSDWNWFEIFNWDGHNEFWDGRRVDNLLPYSPNDTYNDIYELGTLWASCLMSLRLELGDSIMDRIVLEALYYSFQDMTVWDAGSVLLEADTALYQGTYSSDIRDRLCQLNLINIPGCIAVALDGLEGEEANPIYYDRAAKAIQVYPVGKGKGSLEIWNTLGQKVFEQGFLGNAPFSLNEFPFDQSGVLLVRMTQGGKEVIRKLNIVL